MKAKATHHTKAVIFNSLSFITLLPPILLLVLAVLFISSTMTVSHNFRSEMTKMVDNNLAFVSQNLDFLFRDVLTSASGYSVNTEVKSISYKDETSSGRVNDSRKLQLSLANLTTTKDFIEHAYLYFPGQQYVVSDLGVYDAPEALFAAILPNGEVKPLQNFDELEFAAFLPEQKVQDAVGRTFKAIPFLYPVSENCKLLFLLDSDYLDEILFGAQYDMFSICLKTSEGRIIKSSGVPEEEDSFIRAEAPSKQTSLRYDISVPMSAVGAESAGVIGYAIPLVLLLLLSSGVSFYLLRRKVYHPICNMVNNMERMLPPSEETDQPKKKKFELLQLQQNIDEMFSENCAFKLRESESNEMQNELHLQRVLFDVASEEDFEQLDRDCAALESYVVLDIMVEPAQAGQEELQPLREQLLDGILQVAEVEHLYSGSDVLFPYLVQVRSRQEYTSLLELLHDMDEMAQEAKMFLLFAVSRMHRGAGEVKAAAEEASCLLRERSAACEERVLSAIHQEEFCPSGEVTGILTFEREKALVNSLHGGLADTVSEMMEELFEGLRRMPYWKYCEQCDYLIRILLMAVSTSSIQSDFYKQISAEYYGSVRNTCNPDRLEEFVREGYCRAASLASDGSKKDTKKKILQYIDENLCSAITLQAVAEACGISSQYLSAYFKKEMGINFKTYVDTCKMEEAKRRLMQTGSSIQQVAQSLGFSESKNFIRVFKKYESMTPGEYRDSMGYRREDYQ